MNIYCHPASEISCCLAYNISESVHVLFARPISHGLLHTTCTDQTQCVGGDWGGSLQKANVQMASHWSRPITPVTISTYMHQLLLLGWRINRHCPDNFQYDYINTIYYIAIFEFRKKKIPTVGYFHRYIYI